MFNFFSSKKKAPPKIDAQPGDILLFTRARGLNRIITWFTKSKYYHVAIYAGESHVVESRPRGVVCRDLNGPDGDKSFVVIPAPGGRETGMQALEWARAQLGTPYDPVGVLALVIDRMLSCSCVPWSTSNYYSCGELVVNAFRHANKDLFPERHPESVVPADFEPYLPPRPKKYIIRPQENAAP